MALISAVIPVYNEQENLPQLADRVFAVADRLREDCDDLELVLVDDSSSDRTQQIAKELVGIGRHVRYIRLSRNCGSHAALAAGLQFCVGDAAILMAADLQDPPELITTFIEHWRKGFEVVWAVREGRDGEKLRTRTLARIYYRIMRWTALPDLPATGADFVLIDRKVINAFLQIPERNTSIMAVIHWMGFRQTSFDYVKQARRAGRSKWTLAKKVKLLIDSIVSFSYLPIRLMAVVGALMACCGFLYATIVIVARFQGWISAEKDAGFAALMTVLLVSQGTILFMLSVLGEYLWRTFDEARGRPRYMVQEHIHGGSNVTSRPSDDPQSQLPEPEPPSGRSLPATSANDTSTTT